MQLSERLATGDSSRPSRTQPIGTTGGKSSEMVFTDPFPAKRADSAVSVGSVGSATVRMDPSVAKRHQSPFPPLHLSPANATSMENLAQNLVSRNIRMYESFLLDNHSKVDETQWKFVAAKDDLRAYGELPRSSESPHPGYQLETPAADVPVVMITGSVVGDLDDVIHMKKLAWALRQKYNGETSSSSSECTEDSSSGSFDDKCCSGCGKKQSVFVQAASRTNRGSKILQKRRHCKICSRYMCLDCRRQHQLTFLLPDQRLKQRLVTICRSCEAEALSESAAAIARDEQLQSNQLQRWDSDDVFHTTMSAQSE
ncbi:hypothetical protein KRP22_004790 [Phytophthora ramorum]|nr:hypothetical protein KRP22_10421 [Phytophthora ramorum]